MNYIRVFIAEEQLIISKALQALIDAAPDMMVIGDLFSGGDFSSLLENKKPPVVLIGVSYYKRLGKAAFKKIRENYPTSAWIVLSDQLLVKEADLTVSTSAQPEYLLTQIRKFGRKKRAELLSIENVVLQKTERLTFREKEIVDLVILGSTSDEIGEKLNISTNTVITHRRNINKKLGVKNVAELISKLG
jgi:DNA-binding NarL/FixJ family response regulator